MKVLLQVCEYILYSKYTYKCVLHRSSVAFRTKIYVTELVDLFLLCCLDVGACMPCLVRSDGLVYLPSYVLESHDK